MKKLVLSCLLIAGILCSGWSQEYKTHKVKVGETIEEIAKTYMVTPYDIYALNPDAKTDLEPNMVIVIPRSRVAKTPTESEEQQLSGFKKHKVKRKETLYSISKKYNVSVDDIKKHNKWLYSQNLRKGDKIQIPEFTTVKVTNILENTIKTYRVKPKEGKWRVAYKFGITVDELERLNPQLGDTLRVDQEINVPNIADNEVKSVDDSYGYYTVLPKEGFYRLKLKLGMTQEELEALNPELKDDGLKAGMVLKVPKDVGSSANMESVEFTNLKSKIANFDEKNIALMLPFRLHRIDLDSVREARETVRKDRYMSIALDFYSGVLTALDSAKKLGISTKLDVYDTQARTSVVSRLLSDNDFTKYDAVIGPFMAEGFDRAAERLKGPNVPVISPVTAPKKLYSNVFQTIPSDEYLKNLMINFVKADSLAENIFIIADSKHRALSNSIKKDLPRARQIFSRKDKEGRDANYILKDDVELEIKEGRTIVFLETSNEGFVSNVTSILSALNGVSIIETGKDKEETIEREIILMTTNKNRAFEGINISNLDLSNLRFHYPSVNRNTDEDVHESFIDAYKREYNALPNKYAVRGYDLTLDILLRLASEENLYDASSDTIETEYVENKFRYSKKLFGGYYNESAYIVKYDDLQILEVKQ